MQAYDQHLNMVLGDVEETITTREIDEETYEELIKVYLVVPTFVLLVHPIEIFMFLYLHLYSLRKPNATLKCFLFEEMGLF